MPKDVRVEREKILAGRGSRFDLTICDRSGSPLLVLENKFKSFPTREQLEKYNEELKKAKPEPVAKYLMVFNKNVLRDCRPEELGWRVLTYADAARYFANT